MQSAWFWHKPTGHTGGIQPSGTQCLMVVSKNVPVAHGMRTKTLTSVQTMYDVRSNGSLNAWISGDLKTSSVHGLDGPDRSVSIWVAL